MDELDALKAIDAGFAGLIDDDARARALLWVNAKYGKGLVASSAAGGHPPPPGAPASPVAHPQIDLSVGTIAQRLSAKTAGEVLRAAAASLTLVQKKAHFSWKELLAEAAKATGYWTKYHPGNAGQAAKKLRADGILVELANGNLGLSPTAKLTLAQTLGAGTE